MLQELMALPPLEYPEALAAAATRIAHVLTCEKVDAFLLDDKTQTLRALGTSDTPLGRRQRELGLHALPLANGGRTVEAFKSGVAYLEHHAELDPDEVRGLVEELGIRSTLSVPFDVNGVRRGVLAAASPTPEFFQPSDLKALEIIAHWVAMLTYRTELAELTRKVDTERARRSGADEIITVLAHDFRNHLQPLLARLQLMRMNLDNGQGVSRVDVERAVKSVERLSRLTTDILDLKRLDEGLFALSLAPVDLAAIARETASSLSTGRVPVQATGAPSLIAIADGERVRQVLENLVANAIKYSPPGKSVELRVSFDDGNGNPRAVLEVLDEGPGVSPEMASKLFDRFSSSADSKGIGLGLHLAKRIALAHQGELDVHSRPERGSCFRLVLPTDSG
jgi:two-component system, OmpR family, sensor kinase